MIRKDKNLEYVVKGQNPFIDKRGEINNYKLTEKVNLVATITSKKNTLRSNHFHPVQQQKCLLISGQYVSIYKDLKIKNSKIITHLINQGDLVITEPLVAHTMVFKKDSTFLNLVKGEREHKNYGKTHTKFFELVNKKDKKFIYENYKTNCRVCDQSDFLRVLSLGYQPFANNFTKKVNNQSRFPLELNLCKNCKNAQLSIIPDFKKLFSNYLYKSSVGKSFINHFESASSKLIKELSIKKNDLIIDIGSNDGIGLLPFKNKGYNNVLGIEPAKNLSKISKNRGIKTINQYFNKNILKKIKSKAKLILASNVFAHADELDNVVETVKKTLKSKSFFIIEVQYFPDMFKDLSFDNIYHEHVNYWSITSMFKFFKKHKLNLFKVEKINTHGGSVRVYISNYKKPKSNSVKKFLEYENRIGINNNDLYLQFGDKIEKIKENVLKNLKKLKKKHKNIVGYGAPAKASTLINYFGIDEKLIKYIIDDNKLKINRYIPGTGIKIISKKNLKKVNCVVVFAWNFFKEIKNSNKKISNNFINIRDLF